MNRGTIVEKETKHPYIIRDKKICNGSPTVKGSRVRVIDIATEYELSGMTPDEIVDNHPHLRLSQVHDALSYYYENKRELDEHYKNNLEFIEKIKKQYPSKMDVFCNWKFDRLEV